MALARATASLRALTKSLPLLGRLPKLSGAPPRSARALGLVGACSALVLPLSRAVFCKQQGPPDAVTRVVEVPPVLVKENDVCVRILAASINPSDINTIEVGAMGKRHAINDELGVSFAIIVDARFDVTIRERTAKIKFE